VGDGARLVEVHSRTAHVITVTDGAARPARDLPRVTHTEAAKL